MIDLHAEWCHFGSIMNVTIKNLPRGVHRRLKSQAALNKRSLNGEIVEILEKAMQSQPVNIDDFIADLDRFHARHKIPPITEEMLRAAKNEGRP